MLLRAQKREYERALLGNWPTLTIDERRCRNSPYLAGPRGRCCWGLCGWDKQWRNRAVAVCSGDFCQCVSALSGSIVVRKRSPPAFWWCVSGMDRLRVCFPSVVSRSEEHTSELQSRG